MEDKEKRVEDDQPVILHTERRKREQSDLSCEEIMEIVRKRGAKRSRKVTDVD